MIKVQKKKNRNKNTPTLPLLSYSWVAWRRSTKRNNNKGLPN